MYVILPISLIGLIPAWFILRRFTQIWILRPVSIKESIYSGLAAWVLLFSSIVWLGGIVLTFTDFLANHLIENIVIPVFSLFVTGFIINFFNHSRTEMGIDDTMDFIKEALQFRRSAQRRMDILSLIQSRQEQKGKTGFKKDREFVQRVQLQAELNKEKEFENQFAQLKEGSTIDISEDWLKHTKTHAVDTIFVKIKDVKIDPKRKRLILCADFPDMTQENLKDDTTILKLNREVYDFLQSLGAEPWLKHYAPFYENYFLMCRGLKKNESNEEFYYPFMKVGVQISELLKYEGTYFNPRKLGEIAALAFKNGAPV